MPLTKLTTDLNIIAALPDQPNQSSGLTAAQMKAKYDEGTNDIKAYINDTLTPELDTLDAANVKLSGDQTIEGVKTFSSSPVIPAPTSNSQAVTKKYTDDLNTAQTDALTSHKTSGDHDGRYYTVTEVDNTFETKSDLTNNRKLSPDGNFTGKLNGYSIVAADPGYSSMVAGIKDDLDAHKADNAAEISALQISKAEKTEVNSLATAKANQVDLLAEIANRTNAISAEESARLAEIAVERSRIDLLKTSAGDYYLKCLSTDTGALLVVASGATTGQINIANVTPRINTFTPVAGDYVRLISNGLTAELIDIRIGADGVTYTNAGGAIRGQISNLKQDIGNLDKSINLIGFTSGAYINTSGSTVNVSTPTKSPDWKYAVVACNGGEKFTISGKGGSTPRLWCFIDAGGNVLSVASLNETVTERVLFSPANSAQLIINDNNSNGEAWREESIKSKFNGLVSLNSELLGLRRLEFTDFGYINLGTTPANVSTPVSSIDWRHSVNPCSSGDRFTITGKGGSSPRLWGFVDAGGNVLSVADGGIQLTNYTLIAPYGAEYFVVNDNRTGGLCYTGTPITNEIKNCGLSRRGVSWQYNILLDNDKLKDCDYGYHTEFIPSTVKGVEVDSTSYKLCYAKYNKSSRMFVSRSPFNILPYYDFDHDNYMYKLSVIRSDETTMDYSEIDHLKLIFNNEETFNNNVMNRLIGISDSANFLSGDGPQVAIDEDRGMCYALYNGSQENYGEGHGIMQLAVFPIHQPYSVKYYTVATPGETYGELTFVEQRDDNILMYDTFVRIYFFEISTNTLWYRDFDKNTKTFGDALKCTMQVSEGSSPVEFTVANMEAYYTSLGYSWIEIDNPIEQCGNIVKKDGKYYTIITFGSTSRPTLAYTVNGYNWVFVNTPDVTLTYEAALGYYGRWYMIARNAGMYYSEDDFTTLTRIGTETHSGTRPDIVQCDDGVILCMSYDGVATADKTPQGRTNITMYKGNGTTITDFNPIYNTLINRLGICYYRVINFHSVLYLITTTGELYPQKRTGDQSTKNEICFVRLGDLIN